MKYFSKITASYVPKNKLQKSIIDELEWFDNMLILSDKELENYIRILKVVIFNSYLDNAKCKMLTLNIFDYDNLSEPKYLLTVDGATLFQITIYRVKTELG